MKLCSYISSMGDLIFIMDDHDNFPNLMMIQIYLSLGKRFSLFIVN